MILSQMKSWRFLAGRDLMFSWTSRNSAIEATSKLAPASYSVSTMAGSEFALTA